MLPLGAPRGVARVLGPSGREVAACDVPREPHAPHRDEHRERDQVRCRPTGAAPATRRAAPDPDPTRCRRRRCGAARARARTTRVTYASRNSALCPNTSARNVGTRFPSGPETCRLYLSHARTRGNTSATVLTYPCFAEPGRPRRDRCVALRRKDASVSRTTRILLLALPIVLTVAVLGYAVVATMQVQREQAGLRPASAHRGLDRHDSAAQPRRAPGRRRDARADRDSGAKRGTIIFDMAHSEVFGPQDPSELGQSKAVERMRAAGYAVRVITEKISKSTLGPDVAAVYLPGPMVPLIGQGAHRARRLRPARRHDDHDRPRAVPDSGHARPLRTAGRHGRHGRPGATGRSRACGRRARSRRTRSPSGVKTLTVVSGWPVEPVSVRDRRPAHRRRGAQGRRRRRQRRQRVRRHGPAAALRRRGRCDHRLGSRRRSRRRCDLREHRHRHERQREVPRQPARAHLGAATGLDPVSRAASMRERTPSRKVGGRHGYS